MTRAATRIRSATTWTRMLLKFEGSEWNDLLRVFDIRFHSLCITHSIYTHVWTQSRPATHRRYDFRREELSSTKKKSYAESAVSRVKKEKLAHFEAHYNRRCGSVPSAHASAYTFSIENRNYIMGQLLTGWDESPSRPFFP